MSYRITQYTRDRARRLGVTVRRAANPRKKIDVFDAATGTKLASVGAAGYGDYPTFRRTHGAAHASRRRTQYKRRHAEDRHVRGSPGYFADQLLW